MTESAYRQVQLAVKIAERSTWKPEGVRAIESARKAWYVHIDGTYCYADEFMVANAVARRIRGGFNKWPRFDHGDFEYYAGLRVYNLLTQLLLRLKYNPASLNAHFWSRLRFELWDNKFWLRDHPQRPVHQVPEFLSHIASQMRPEPED